MRSRSASTCPELRQPAEQQLGRRPAPDSQSDSDQRRRRCAGTRDLPTGRRQQRAAHAVARDDDVPAGRVQLHDQPAVHVQLGQVGRVRQVRNGRVGLNGPTRFSVRHRRRLFHVRKQSHHRSKLSDPEQERPADDLHSHARQFSRDPHVQGRDLVREPVLEAQRDRIQHIFT